MDERWLERASSADRPAVRILTIATDESLRRRIEKTNSDAYFAGVAKRWGRHTESRAAILAREQRNMQDMYGLPVRSMLRVVAACPNIVSFAIDSIDYLRLAADAFLPDCCDSASLGLGGLLDAATKEVVLARFFAQHKAISRSALGDGSGQSRAFAGLHAARLRQLELYDCVSIESIAGATLISLTLTVRGDKPLPELSVLSSLARLRRFGVYVVRSRFQRQTRQLADLVLATPAPDVRLAYLQVGAPQFQSSPLSAILDPLVAGLDTAAGLAVLTVEAEDRDLKEADAELVRLRAACDSTAVALLSETMTT